MFIPSTSLPLFAILVPEGRETVFSPGTRKSRQDGRELCAAFSRIRMERAGKDAVSFSLTANGAAGA